MEITIALRPPIELEFRVPSKSWAVEEGALERHYLTAQFEAGTQYLEVTDALFYPDGYGRRDSGERGEAEIEQAHSDLYRLNRKLGLYK